MRYINRALVFIINGLLILIAVILMKESSQKKAALVKNTDIETDPLSASVAENQSIIYSDRENKLRALADTPKDAKKTTVTTQTTTTTKTPKSSSSSSTSAKTRTS